MKVAQAKLKEIGPSDMDMKLYQVKFLCILSLLLSSFVDLCVPCIPIAVDL